MLCLVSQRKEIKLTEFVTALMDSTNGLSASAFTTQLTAFVPYLVVMIPLAFGIRTLFKILKKPQKGKAI